MNVSCLSARILHHQIPTRVDDVHVTGIEGSLPPSENGWNHSGDALANLRPGLTSINAGTEGNGAALFATCKRATRLDSLPSESRTCLIKCNNCWQRSSQLDPSTTMIHFPLRGSRFCPSSVTSRSKATSRGGRIRVPRLLVPQGRHSGANVCKPVATRIGKAKSTITAKSRSFALRLERLTCLWPLPGAPSSRCR